MDDLINRCAKCRWHDGLFCCNPNSYFYGWFRNDWKSCDKWTESSGAKMDEVKDE